MEKTQLKRLKQLSRSELLEVMLALKRENDILTMENIRLKTIKHKLENELQEIIEKLEQIEIGANNEENSSEIEQDGAWVDNDTFESVYESERTAANAYVSSESSFDSVFDSYIDEVTNK